ncbi:MAG: N-acetyltransferase [Acidobacteria bacterium]|nr:N-acetyltransferase [Acidobacteriota bacterium]MCA1609600.1 N-acetyltransferase [Acidobacteriota bacterium]
MADSSIAVQPIGRSKKELSRFFDVADRIYADDPLWVAPIRDDVAKVFSPKNPFFLHGEIQLFVASKDGRDAGRIAAIVDRNHNEFHGDRTGFFGYFESDNDPAVAGALFDAAAGWVRERGMDTLRGPTNPTLNDEAGLLVDGFDSSPVLMMTYNPRYYVGLVESSGFRKAKDLLAYWFEIKVDPLARLTRMADRIARREKDVVVRKISKKSLASDLPKIREVYNAAWEKNWGFVPMTSEEMDFMAKRLKPLVDEDFLFLAEFRCPDGTAEPIAFMLTLPDYNVAMKPLKGRLLPFGWLKFLLGLKKIRSIRVLTLGIKKEWRLRGIQAVMFEKGLRAALERRYTGCEMSWLLEDNEAVIRAADLWGGRVYKTYRMFDRNVG